MPEFIVTNHWLFAGRFVVYILCFVMLFGAVIDWHSARVRRPGMTVWPYYAMLITASFAIMLTSPARFEVLRRLLDIEPTEPAVNAALFVGLVFSMLSFIFAQITRMYIRGASRPLMIKGAVTATLGIALLAVVGVGLDVRFP